MIKWAEPTYLWLLLLVPTLGMASLVWGIFMRRRLLRAVDAKLVPEITSSVVPALGVEKRVLLLGGLAFLIVAAARPKWGEKLQLYKGRGVDVVIALDASKSMLAEDVKPNRLARAKAELGALIEGLGGNAVGITAFAGDCFVMCPLTTDLEAAKLFLDIIEPDAMPVPGTDFGRAIDVSMGLFSVQERKYKALVLVTDGEDLGKNTAQAIQRAAEAGVRIFPVAFSTAEGGVIPEYDERGNLKSYKKDRQGQTVMSRMNERLLFLMARATGGRFMRVEGFSAERLLAELNAMEKKEIGGGAYAEYVERYQLFLALALALFGAGLVLSNRRGSWLPVEWRRRWGGRKWKFLVAAAAFCVLGGAAAQADVGALMRKGNGLYARGKYEEALEMYQQAGVLEPDATAIRYNLGNTLYRLGKYQEAVKELELAATDKNAKRRAEAFYNIGNALYRSGVLEGAIKAYISALVLNPADRQAKENLEFCLKKRGEAQRDSSRQEGGQKQSQPQQSSASRPEPQMSREQAERVLEAVESKEKEEQKKRQQQLSRRRRVVEKDW